VVGYGERCPFPTRKGYGEGAWSFLPRKFLDFWRDNDMFWCIIGTFYTRASIAIARISYGNSVGPSVCLSVRPGVTYQYCSKTR